MKRDEFHATERTVRSVLALVLGLSILVPAVLAGERGAWSLPPWRPLDLWVLAAATAVSATAVGCLWMMALAHERLRGGVRLAVSLGLCGPLVLVFYALGPVTHIGDWDWVMAYAEHGTLFGRWYGATALYAAFHALARRAGMSALESVRLCSSVCGALSAYVFFRLLRALGTTDVVRAWPWLYLSAFGVVGVGLAHVEIYAAVVLVMALVLWLGVEVIVAPSPSRLLAFAVASAAATLTYVSGALLLPASLGLLLWVARRAWAARAARLAAAALAAAALVPGLLLLAHRFGPPAKGNSLAAVWMAQIGSGSALPSTPPFHPPDVLWAVAPSLMAPRYWFSAVHLGDFAQSLFLDDRAGVALAVALLGLGLWRLRRGYRFSAASVFLLGVALPFAGYAFTAVNARAMPWDWDVRSHLALVTSALAAALLVSSVDRPYGRQSNALLIAVGIAAQLAGLLFLYSCARQPEALGPPAGGLRLAVAPVRVEVTPTGETFAPLWFWLYDDGDRPFEAGWVHMRYGWKSTDYVGGGIAGRRTILGSRLLAPRSSACLADVDRVPLHWKAVALLAQGGIGQVLEGRLVVWLDGDRAHPPLRLESNPVQLVVRQR